MQQKVFVTQSFSASLDTVFADFSDHERFGQMLGLRMKRVKEGLDELNGLGSVRRLDLDPLPTFEETIVVFEPNQCIEYKVTKGLPLKNHKGTMIFSEQDGKVHIEYTIVFESRIPYMGGIIRNAIESSVIKGLKRYAESL